MGLPTLEEVEDQLQSLLEKEDFFRPGSERISLSQALGRIVARAPRAQVTLPPFTRAHYDGFALRAEDALPGKVLPIAGEIAMGKEAPRPLRRDEVWSITTGGHLPPGADAVVPLEDVEILEGAIRLKGAIGAGQYVTAKGADVEEGEALLPPGRRLLPMDLSLLWGAGVREVEVHKRPTAGLFLTGSEIRSPHLPLLPGTVWDSLSPSLGAWLEGWGWEVKVIGPLREDRGALQENLMEALQQASLCLIIGGSSRGKGDVTANAVAAVPGATILGHGIALQPGRPTLWAKAPGPEGRATFILGLPGHPVSALLVFFLLGWPVARQLAGERHPWVRGKARAFMMGEVRAGTYEFIARVELRRNDKGELWAHPLAGDSAILKSLAGSAGFVRVPPGQRLEEGQEVEVELWMSFA
ncbi:MAG: molybdopterin molybdotransferase MoeA [Bacillota bacterium]|nr:molybdopterin molybdotransferase MoeA [Bacillota bacterium]